MLSQSGRASMLSRTRTRRKHGLSRSMNHHFESLDVLQRKSVFARPSSPFHRALQGSSLSNCNRPRTLPDPMLRAAVKQCYSEAPIALAMRDKFSRLRELALQWSKRLAPIHTVSTCILVWRVPVCTRIHCSALICVSEYYQLQPVRP